MQTLNQLQILNPPQIFSDQAYINPEHRTKTYINLKLKPRLKKPYIDPIDQP